MAQRQQVEESDRRERAIVAQVLFHLVFHRNNICKNVPVRDDHAFGIGRGAGSEDDFRCLIFRNSLRLEGRLAIIQARLCAGQNQARVNNILDALYKFR